MCELFIHSIWKHDRFGKCVSNLGRVHLASAGPFYRKCVCVKTALKASSWSPEFDMIIKPRCCVLGSPVTQQYEDPKGQLQAFRKFKFLLYFRESGKITQWYEKKYRFLPHFIIKCHCRHFYRLGGRILLKMLHV